MIQRLLGPQPSQLLLRMCWGCMHNVFMLFTILMTDVSSQVGTLWMHRDRIIWTFFGVFNAQFECRTVKIQRGWPKKPWDFRVTIFITHFAWNLSLNVFRFYVRKSCALSLPMCTHCLYRHTNLAENNVPAPFGSALGHHITTLQKNVLGLYAS